MDVSLWPSIKLRIKLNFPYVLRKYWVSPWNMLVGLMMEECTYFVCSEKYHDRASNFDEDPNASITQGNGPFPLGFDVFECGTVTNVKEKIASIQGVDLYPAAQQLLIHLGKLYIDVTTSEETVTHDNFVVITLPKVQPASSLPPSIRPFGHSVGNVNGQAASNLVAGSTLRSTVQLIDMGGDRLDWDVVILALLSAYNNPERVIEYVNSVQPASSLSLSVLPLKASQAPVRQRVFPAPAPTPAPAAPTPFPVFLEENVYGQAVSNLVPRRTLGSTAQEIIGMGGSWDWYTVICALPSTHNNLERAPEYIDFPTLLELGKKYLNLMLLIKEPRAESLRLITEPVGGEWNISGQLAGIMPQAVTLTPEKIRAIERVNKKEILIEKMWEGAMSYLEDEMCCDCRQFIALRVSYGAGQSSNLTAHASGAFKANSNLMHLIQEHQAETLINEPIEWGGR